MALLIMIFRKMYKNRWLECCLLTGLIATVALASSMPIYTGSILHRMLVKDLENSQRVSSRYPGTFTVKASNIRFAIQNATPEEMGKRVYAVDGFMKDTIIPRLKMPVLVSVQQRESASWSFVPADSSQGDPDARRSGSFTALSGLEEHIVLTDGRLPAEQPVNGVYEALVTEGALNKQKMVLGNEFVIKDKDVKENIKIIPVGVIDRKDYSDLFWNRPLAEYDTTFIIPFSRFEQDITSGKLLKLLESTWYLAYDYTKVSIKNTDQLLHLKEQSANYVGSQLGMNSVQQGAESVFKAYSGKETKLRLMLWSLHAPVLIMLAFYLFLVANQITDRQKTEIAVLRSRGAGRWQIITAYAVEGGLLGVVALAAGPFLGLAITEALGSANGFLEFVQRGRIEASLSYEAYRYALTAVACSVFMTLLPVFTATRATIVGHKQQLARVRSVTLAHKFGLDIILLGISLYGLYSFRRRISDLKALGLDSLDFKVDPLLFVVPALFILGLGLLILRIYPWFVRLVYLAGRRWWSPSLYSTLIQVGRSATGYQFIMLFLVLTIATGLFGASAARTINSNSEDQLRYRNGADLVLSIRWDNDAPPPSTSGNEPPGNKDKAAAPVSSSRKVVQYTEPPFTPFTQLPGVEHAAKVFSRDISIGGPKSTTIGKLMGIESDEFGLTAWMRNGVMDHHLFEYLNLLAVDPAAVLVSRSIADIHGIKPGDSLNIGWNDAPLAPFRVYGIIDYWPTFNPNPPVGSAAAKASGDPERLKAVMPQFVVGNLPYIQSNIALEPYNVWLKLKPGASVQAVYDSIEAEKLPLLSAANTVQDIVDSRKDPFRLAVNGAMTLGFLISIGVCFLGFLLYWLLSFAGRTLQFGIYRAMGITLPQLIGMVVVEQLLTSGAAAVIGIGTGIISSQLFVPFFQLSFNLGDQVPPFKVIFDAVDEMRLYSVVSVMMALGLCILGMMLSRIKIHQAVKLGED